MGFFLRAGSAKREQQLVARPSCVYKKLRRGRLGLFLSERPGARSGSGSLPPAFLRLQEAGRGRLIGSFPQGRERETGAAACRRPSCVYKKPGRGRLGLSLSERPGARSGSGSLPPPFLRLQKAGARAAWAVPFQETRGAKRERQLAARPSWVYKKRGAGGLLEVFLRAGSAKWERQLAAGACERMRECVVRFTKLKNKNMGSIPNRKCKNIFLPVFFMKKETI